MPNQYPILRFRPQDPHAIDAVYWPIACRVLHCPELDPGARPCPRPVPFGARSCTSIQSAAKPVEVAG